MKSIMEIAIECDTTYDKIFRMVKKERLVSACMFGKKKFTKWQVDYIQEILYYEGVLNEITIKSRMNNN